MIINGELHFLKALKSDDRLVFFDVGANRGQWTEAVISLFSNAEVHCFEPVESSYKYLTSRGFPSNVVLNHIGFGDHTETVKINIYGDGSEINSLYESWIINSAEKEDIQLMTSATYCNEKQVSLIFYMKIDVEGHDFAVIEGSRRLFEKGVISLAQFEYGSNWITARHYLKDVFDFVSELPYRIFRVMPFGLLRLDSYDVSLDNFEHANYLLVHNAFEFPSSIRISNY